MNLEKSKPEGRKPSEIWADDLFGRSEEAGQLIGYIESISQLARSRESASAYTLAVDAGYGEGKTFFLKRLAEHIALSHPVAFVDAWTDDLADEPLTALAATLKQAITPLFPVNRRLRKRWKNVASRAGDVAIVAGKGAVKRLIGAAVGHEGAEAISHFAGQFGETLTEELKGASNDASKEGVEAAFKTAKPPPDWMQQRINDFEAGRKAIRDLKESLAALVDELRARGPYEPPIVILIDELDRCRPTYSIKLLEEIKHLFDVPGLVFIFGMFGTQLERSIKHAYGADFDGASYLKRFINRRYRLRTPSLEPLIKELLKASGIQPERLGFPMIEEEGLAPKKGAPEMLIAAYLEAYNLKPRDAFRLMDILQTCAGLTGSAKLELGYLLPLLLTEMTFGEGYPLTRSPRGFKWTFWIGVDRGFDRSAHTPAPDDYAAVLDQLSNLDERQLNQNDSYEAHMVLRSRSYDNRLAHIGAYPSLLQTVGRFTNPALDDGARRQHPT